jgi:subtilisin-like proprotein convertase family protein
LSSGCVLGKFSAAAPLRLPAAGPAEASSGLTISPSGLIGELYLSYTLENAADAELRLVSPAGVTALIRANGGAASAKSLALPLYAGAEASGTWSLNVTRRRSGGSVDGALLSWSLLIVGRTCPLTSCDGWRVESSDDERPSLGVSVELPGYALVHEPFFDVWVRPAREGEPNPRAVLVSPKGTRRPLRGRTPQSRELGLYGVASEFDGEDGTGTWKLEVESPRPALMSLSVYPSGRCEVIRPTAARYSGFDVPAAIPDFGGAPLRKTIALNSSGVATSVAVSLSVSHPSPSDLDISLLTPTGERLSLWTKQRATSGIVLDRVELPSLANRPVRGDYVLEIIDTVSRDVGTLDRWSLEVAGEGETAGCVRREVPKRHSSAVEWSQLALAGPGRVRQLGLVVEGLSGSNLPVELILSPPGGLPVTLTYASSSVLPTASQVIVVDQLVGSSLRGTWTLRSSNAKFLAWRLLVDPDCGAVPDEAAIGSSAATVQSTADVYFVSFEARGTLTGLVLGRPFHGNRLSQPLSVELTSPKGTVEHLLFPSGVSSVRSSRFSGEESRGVWTIRPSPGTTPEWNQFKAPWTIGALGAPANEAETCAAGRYFFGPSTTVEFDAERGAVIPVLVTGAGKVTGVRASYGVFDGTDRRWLWLTLRNPRRVGVELEPSDEWRTRVTGHEGDGAEGVWLLEAKAPPRSESEQRAKPKEVAVVGRVSLDFEADCASTCVRGTFATQPGANPSREDPPIAVRSEGSASHVRVVVNDPEHHGEVLLYAPSGAKYTVRTTAAGDEARATRWTRDVLLDGESISGTWTVALPGYPSTCCTPDFRVSLTFDDLPTPCGVVVADNQCASGMVACYPDADSDGFVKSTTPVLVCGGCDPSRGQRQQLTSPLRWDCADTLRRVNPSQTEFFDRPYVAEGSGEPSWDYDCNGSWENRYGAGPCRRDWRENWGGFCSADKSFLDSTLPSCGKKGTLATCRYVDEKCTQQSYEASVMQVCR